MRYLITALALAILAGDGAYALSVTCSSRIDGSATDSPTGVGFSEVFTGCDATLSNQVTGFTPPDFWGGDAEATAASSILAQFTIAGGSFELFARGTASGQAISNGGLISAGNYSSPFAQASSSANHGVQVVIASGEAFAYELQVSVRGGFDDGVVFALTGETFRGNGVNLETHFRSGVIPAGAGQVFSLGGFASTLASARAGGTISDVADSGLGDFEIRFRLTPLPEPSPGALIAITTAVAVVARVRRTRRSKPTE